METDKDHIHYMIETEPTMSISKIVNLMKSYTAYHIWKRYPDYLRKHFWKEHTFWTDGYFLIANKEFRLQKHLAVAVLFTIRHWHIGKKYTRKRKSQLVKRIVIITVTEN